jgi:SecD/SecF fusion protein
LALLLFGGSTLKDFAFALLIGVASGAYSSIFIASPVLMHWKEREPVYRARRQRIIGELGMVPAYAGVGADIEPARKRIRRPGRLTTPEPETLSTAEFEEMKRQLGVEEEAKRAGHTSTLTKRLAHKSETEEEVDGEEARPKPGRRAGKPRPPADSTTSKPASTAADSTASKPARSATDTVAPQTGRAPTPTEPQPTQTAPVENGAPKPAAPDPGGAPVQPAPDEAENDGVASTPKSARPAKRSRNRRHGRRR